ncbi:MAG TPA: CBS domain-containing protein, partial [Anaeromyxobacteraceae bacterium]
MARQTVQKHMTLSPQVISSRYTLAQAHQVMRERNIRHLPVVDDGRLVGVISQRDLYLLETLRGVDPAAETVK